MTEIRAHVERESVHRYAPRDCNTDGRYLLVADPAGVDYEATARCFGQDRTELLKETEMTLIACNEISKRLLDSRGSFQVRLMDRVFTSGVYFFDPQDKDGSMFLVPHVPGTDAPITPGFEFRRVNGGLLDDYYGIYKGVWNGKNTTGVRPYI